MSLHAQLSEEVRSRRSGPKVGVPFDLDRSPPPPRAPGPSRWPGPLRAIRERYPEVLELQGDEA